MGFFWATKEEDNKALNTDNIERELHAPLTGVYGQALHTMCGNEKMVAEEKGAKQYV